MKKLAQIASNQSTWNTMRPYQTLIKVIDGLLNGNLMEIIQKDFDRLKKDGSEHYMSYFYNDVVKLNETLPFLGNEKKYLDELEKDMFPNKNVREDVLTGHILQGNYKLLKKEGLAKDYLGDFYGYFKGDLVAAHRIPFSDIIIFETKQKPFSNEKQYHWDEEDEAKFYSNKNTSFVWRTIEECLINTMFPQHYAAVIALHKAEGES